MTRKAFFNDDLVDGNLPLGHCARGLDIPDRIADLVIRCAVPVPPPVIVETPDIPPPPPRFSEGCYLPVVVLQTNQPAQAGAGAYGGASSDIDTMRPKDAPADKRLSQPPGPFPDPNNPFDPDRPYGTYPNNMWPDSVGDRNPAQAIDARNIGARVAPADDDGDFCHPEIKLDVRLGLPVVELQNTVKEVTSTGIIRLKGGVTHTVQMSLNVSTRTHLSGHVPSGKEDVPDAIKTQESVAHYPPPEFMPTLNQATYIFGLMDEPRGYKDIQAPAGLDMADADYSAPASRGSPAPASYTSCHGATCTTYYSTVKVELGLKTRLAVTANLSGGITFTQHLAASTATSKIVRDGIPNVGKYVMTLSGTIVGDFRLATDDKFDNFDQTTEKKVKLVVTYGIRSVSGAPGGIGGEPARALRAIPAGAPEAGDAALLSAGKDEVPNVTGYAFMANPPEGRADVTIIRNNYVFRVRLEDATALPRPEIGMPDLFDPVWVSWISWVAALRMTPYYRDVAKGATLKQTEKLLALYRAVNAMGALLRNVMKSDDDIRALDVLRADLLAAELDLDAWRGAPDVIVPPTREELVDLMNSLRRHDRVLAAAVKRFDEKKTRPA